MLIHFKLSVPSVLPHSCGENKAIFLMFQLGISLIQNLEAGIFRLHYLAEEVGGDSRRNHNSSMINNYTVGFN